MCLRQSTLVLLVVALLTVVSGASANKMQEAYLSQYDQAMTLMGQDKLAGPAKCLGVSVSDMVSISRQVVKSCVEKHIGDTFPTDEQSEALELCIEDQQAKSSKKLGVSEATFERCTEEYEGQSGDAGELAFDAKIEALMNKIGDRDPTEAEQAQIDALLEQQMQTRQKSFEAEVTAYAEQMEKSAKGTEDEITLPYPSNGKLTAHYITGMNMGGVASLPLATIVTPDSPEKLLKFYKGALPAFKVFDLGGATYILMEKDPGKPFNLFDFSVYLQQPHVLISKHPDGTEGMSLVTIGYQPKK